jgi:hypothetical protein
MQKKEFIVNASAKEIVDRLSHGESKTDWNKVKSMSQADVESLAEDEEGQQVRPVLFIPSKYRDSKKIVGM